MNIPKLSFIYAYPLDRGQRNLFQEKGLEYPSVEEIRSVLKEWEELWQETESAKSIIAKLIDVTGRTPERNLECFVYGTGLGAMSTPFLLPIQNKLGNKPIDDKFIDVVIHELLHIFITTNNRKYWGHVEEKYKDEEAVCRNHILLYAMLQETYLDLFNQEPLDFSRTNLPPGYARAIELVKQIGYKEIISEYKALI